MFPRGMYKWAWGCLGAWKVVGKQMGEQLYGAALTGGVGFCSASAKERREERRKRKPFALLPNLTDLPQPLDMTQARQRKGGKGGGWS